MGSPEAWLRGPLEGIDPYLMPAAHALVQAGEDLDAARGLTPEQLAFRPGGAASAAYHLLHLAGSTRRLLTYARGQSLTAEQLEQSAGEVAAATQPAGADELIAGARAALAEALMQIERTPREGLLEPREVGRQRLPSTVMGLLFHIAEHAARHAGQLVTTVRVVRGTES